MQFLRKLITVCQVHFEKVILILALVGLGAAVLILFEASQSEATSLGKKETEMKKGKGRAMAPFDYGRYQAALQMAEKPPVLDFSTPHHLFNPVKWQRKLDGAVIKVQTGKEVGPAALTLQKVTELFFIVSLDRIFTTNSFTLGITHEGAPDARGRARIPKICTLNNKPEISKRDILALREIRGTAEDPELVVQLAETGEKVTVTKDKPFKRLEGYEADLSYPVEGKTFPKLREGAKVHFGGEDYKVVAINSSEVVLSATLNDKKYTVRLAAAR